MLFGFNLMQWIVDRLIDILNALTGPIAPLVNMISSTSLAFTTQNAVVIASWRSMTLVADALLGVFIVIGVIQIMYGDTIGSLRQPVGAFVGKVMLTAILVHLSGSIGEQLLTVNNLLCGIVGADLEAFIRSVNHGQVFNNAQTLVVSCVMALVFCIGIFRVIFQAITRVIRFNLLFVLSGPAFLTSVHPATATIFSSWMRLYVVTIFEQFIQLLTFGLGAQFLIATKQNGLTGFIMAVAMVNLTAQIPALLARFGAAAGGSGGSLGTIVKLAVGTARLFV